MKISEIKPDTVKNICWGIMGGFVTFIYFIVVGIIYGVTIIGIKKAWACFRFALFTLAPFGKNVYTNYGSHKFGNSFWIVTTGWQISFFCMVAAGIAYLTYYGRFLGARWFHLAQFVIAPFGSTIKTASLLSGESAIVGIRDENFFDITK